MWLYLVAILVILLAVWYYQLTKQYGIFEAKGIKEPPKLFPIGTISSGWRTLFGKSNFLQSLNQLYTDYPKERYLGTFSFGMPILMVKELEDIKSILIKDFDHFVDRRDFFGTQDVSLADEDEGTKILANMLTLLTGDKWKVS